MEQLKVVGDAFSISVVLATLLTWLPHIAALLSVIWYVVRIVNEWERFSTKVRGWFNKKEMGNGTDT